MSSTMLMGDMVEPSWRSSIVGRLTIIQNTIVGDMEDMKDMEDMGDMFEL